MNQLFGNAVKIAWNKYWILVCVIDNKFLINGVEVGIKKSRFSNILNYNLRSYESTFMIYI